MARIAFSVGRLNFEVHTFEVEAFITSANQIAMGMGGEEDKNFFVCLSMSFPTFGLGVLVLFLKNYFLGILLVEFWCVKI